MIGAVIWVSFTLFVSAYDGRANAFEIYFWPAVVPPAFLLALGAAVRWALAGRSLN